MSNPPFVRAAIVQTILEYYTPLMRETLTDEPDFRREYGIGADAIVSFSAPNVSFQQSVLFDSIREILRGLPELTIADTKNREWKLTSQAARGHLPVIVISSDERQFRLPEFTILSCDPKLRLRSLNTFATELNLSAKAQSDWRSILSQRALEDEEFEKFHRELRETPIQTSSRIRQELETRNKISVSTLVPSSQNYFEGLIGNCESCNSIVEHAVGEGRQFIEHLLTWRPYDGFLFSLLMSSHSALTAEIHVNHMDNKEVLSAFAFLEAKGDLISQLGAVEVGLRILPAMPEIESIVAGLLKKIRTNRPNGAVSGFKLLAALFVLVDGELARTRIMSSKPPFVRRFASLTHAALLQQHFSDLGADETLCDWAYQVRGEQYYMQSLADMRIDPRWNPSLAAASLMKAHFLNRIVVAARKYEASIENTVLHGLILGAESDSIQSLSKFPYSSYPGPLGDGKNSLIALPPDLADVVKEQLSAPDVGPKSFVALANVALIFRVEPHLIQLAVSAIKKCNYRLPSIEDKEQLLGILNGLAAVAANGRNAELAKELRGLLRRHRQDQRHYVSLHEAIEVCLVASSSHKTLDDWCELVGDWLTEFAFRELKDNDAILLRSRLRKLCHSVPDLWGTCSKAEAALTAYSLI